MSQEDPPEDRQNNELEALEAIYGKDIKDLRSRSVWNQWIPLNLSITLTPQQGSSGINQAFVQVDLHLVCNHEYPNSEPKISLENTKGLSVKILVELEDELKKKASQLVGQEMIFQLCQYVQEFLHQHNKPPAKSFYDEMLHRRKVEQERDLQAQQIEQDRERQYIFEEVQQRQEILKMEAKKRREQRKNSENESEDSINRNSDITENSDDNICNHKTMSIIHFGSRVIHKGQCIKHSPSGCVSYTALDGESGELVDIGEWTFQASHKNDLNSLQRQVSSIEQELIYILKLKHQNLGLYYGIKCRIENDCVIVDLLREFISGSNCHSLFINHSNKPDLDFLRHIAREVLTALEYLHRNNVVHRDINGQFVHLSDIGVVKLSNYSIYRRLSDLNFNDPCIYGKKTDIFKYGLFILSLVQGRSISEETINIPNSIPSDLFDFLKRCLAKEESDRYTASRLLNHQFFHDNIEYLSPKREANMDLERNVSPDTLQKVQHLSQLASGQSRLDNEFEFLTHLGKGAFGDVIKVRNKLDGGYYAIKRIQLNPKNKSLNKKIIREVKLLSRLNHENVVRYYNSWIETTTIKDDENESLASTGKITYEKVLKVVRNNEFTLSDKIGALSPIMKNVEISVTYDSKSKSAFPDSSDEDSSSDEDEPFKSIYREESDSDDGIEFEHDSKSATDSTVSSQSINQNTNSTTESPEIVKKIDCMYIQMEFCEKSTLRTAIDNNLFLDKDRVWRLFREIIEGLTHIHQQGMIHRDLKPVNIFLDYEDHVKIGDFGLATTSIKSKQNDSLRSANVETEKEDTFDESKTGLVGTALYVAPEISMSTKVVYNQKVDIYSLGIILFEMCYRPLDTSMERIKILSKLRLKETIFPEDFVDRKNEKQLCLIRWLLDHDISKRPTSLELLQSDLVPPPVLEECELRELVRHTLNNPQLKGYKYLIASCFTQSVTPAQNITYDKDPSSQNVLKSQQIYDFVRQECVKIFEQHGAQNLPTPLLMPKSIFYDNMESCVKLMTHFGSIVCLPHDLRVPFARYVAWNGITLLRRYSVERVYREKKVFGFHPRELYECAFDIVTPTTGSLSADAEILYIVCEIINELPALKNKRIVIKLNHVSLLKGVLLHYGIKDNHQEVYKQISDVKENKISKNQIQNYFISLGLSDSNISQLLNLLFSEFECSKAAYQFQMITKRKIGEAGGLAREALDDLKLIWKNAESYGLETNQFDIVISPGLIYNIQQYSGMICQFVCEVKKKHKHQSMEVLAAGGRYDSMVAYYRNMVEQANIVNRTSKPSAVGISISLDKMVQVIQKEHLEDCLKPDIPVVAVCSVGSSQLKEKIRILKCLRTFSIKSFLLEITNNDEIEEQINQIKASHVIMLKDNEQGTLKVKFSREDRFQVFNMNELMENPKKILKISDSYQENGIVPGVSRSESKVYNDRSEQNQSATVDILFSATMKISSHSRKRYDMQIRTQLESVVKKLSGYVIVIGFPLETNVVKTLASYLEFENENEFQKSVETVIERHQRYKKDLNEICYEIYEQKTKKNSPTVILFSLNDYFYRIIL